jgi:hypothetical protein
MQPIRSWKCWITYYNKFLKRNEDALLIRVVGGRHTSTSSVPNHGVLLYFYRTPAMADNYM